MSRWRISGNTPNETTSGYARAPMVLRGRCSPLSGYFPGILSLNGFRVLAAELRHYRELLGLPFHHRDPFDRLLVAQAKVEGMTLVSCDSSLKAYGISLLW